MKMDGTKSTTDTEELIQLYYYGRSACRSGRSVCASICGPFGNENPGGSRSIAV